MATAKQRFDLLKAHHEAGHVVVARRLGVGVRYVTLLPEFDTDIGAHAWTESAAYKARDAEPVAFITGLANDAKVSLAGPYAQHQYRPAEDSSVISNEWGRDIEHAKRSV